MRNSVRQALAEARRRLEELYSDRLVRIILYGSQARGDTRAESDVDVLVVPSGPIDVPNEIKKLVSLELDLLDRFDENVTIQPFSLDEYEDLGRPLMMHVHAEGIEV